MSEALDHSEPVDNGQGSRGYRAAVLAVLVLVYTFNFIDRQALAILAPLIQKELKLDDLELGVMLGLPFAALYSTLALPIARLADRWSRSWIMTFALAVWSGCTALCGLAASYPQILLARMGVGVGEAGGVAPAYSLIADYFPARSRARALAIYAFAIPIGSALAVTCGGLIAHSLGWRAAFLAIGLAGLPLAPLLKLVVRDPVRAPLKPGVKAGLWPAMRILFPKPAFWLLSLGAASSSIAGYGLIAWMPSFFLRSFHLSLVQVSGYYSGILLVGGIAGVWLGGWFGDRLGRKSRAAYALIPAGAFLAAVPAFIVAAQCGSPPLAFVLFAVQTGLSLAWLGPVTAAVQHLTPAALRSTGSSLFLLINNLLGLAVGPFFFGAVSQALKPRFGSESLHWAVLLGMGFYVVAALLMTAAAGVMRRDWTD
jgi:MFS family permease